MNGEPSYQNAIKSSSHKISHKREDVTSLTWWPTVAMANNPNFKVAAFLSSQGGSFTSCLDPQDAIVLGSVLRSEPFVVVYINIIQYIESYLCIFLHIYICIFIYYISYVIHIYNCVYIYISHPKHMYIHPFHAFGFRLSKGDVHSSTNLPANEHMQGFQIFLNDICGWEGYIQIHMG